MGGKKQLIGSTDLDVAITNQCGRLIANVIIAYNSILLSALLKRSQTIHGQNTKLPLHNISPVAWQHILFLGRYLFRDNHQPIDIDVLLANIDV